MRSDDHVDAVPRTMSYEEEQRRRMTEWGFTAYPDPAKTWSMRVNDGDDGDETGYPPAPSTVLHEESGSGHDENLTGRSPRQPGCEGNIPGSGPD